MNIEIRVETNGTTRNASLAAGTVAHTCQHCGGDDEFLLVFETMDQDSRWLCSSCYSQAIASRLYRLD